jgi:subtilisin-like proprotein convertase family protein
VIVLAAILTTSAVACSGDDDTGPADVADQESLDDLTEEQRQTVDTAQAWIADAEAVDDATAESLEFVRLDEAPNVTHVTFGQYYDDHPVVGAEIVVHVRDDEVTGANQTLVDAAPAGEASEEVDADEARDNATKAVTGTPEEVEDPELAWQQLADELVLVWRVDLTTVDPIGSWRVLVDAGSGEVLDATQVASDRRVPAAPDAPGASALGRITTAGVKGTAAQDGEACDPGDAPSACLFLPDPIYASGGELEDPSDANDFLAAEALENLDDPESGDLRGEFVDADPDGAPVDAPEEDDGTWATGRGQPGFENAMAYYWIDRVHGLMDELGFGDVRDEAFPVFAVDPQTVDNAFYDGSQIVLGVGSDGINEGEDASGIVHEYGHAVLDEQAPGLLVGDEAGAYHEGFSDLLAFLATVDLRTGDAEVDQGCLFAWAEEGGCIRRVDEDLVYPDDLVQQVHADGTIYTGAIFDIFAAHLAEEGIDIEDCPGSDQCLEVRDRVLTTLLASNEYLTSDVTLPDIAAAYMTANEANFDGEDADLIEDGFAEHGLAGGSSTSIDADGQDTGSVNDADASVAFEISHSFRGDLAVTVGVSDPDGNDLCDEIVIQEPDASDGSQDLSGQVDISDSECTEFLPPSPDQLWFLRAEDTLAQDEGEIVSFTVFDGDDPYPATGLPKPIADADPNGTFAITDGSGESVDTGDGTSDDAGDGPFMSLEIDHSYTGDLSIRAGVGQPDGTVTCSVNVLDPDPNDPGDGGLSGDIDLSECEDQFPPDEENLWFLEVVDTAGEDEGTVESLTLTGPDGEEFDFGELPVDIPDDDEDGIVLVTDGSEGQSTNPSSRAAVASIEIDHPFRGDLAVTVGVLDDEDDVVCEEPLATPDQTDDGEGLSIEAAVEDCVNDYPPSDELRWYLFVADTLAEDTGEIVSATLEGPDGEEFAIDLDGGTEIPDADPDGVLLFFEP